MQPFSFGVGAIIDNRFEIISYITKGGMGVVFKVQDKQDDNIYALKFCGSLNPSLMKRFQREVRIMENISHKHVIQILHSNYIHDPPYFIMPLAKHSLEKVIPIADEDMALSIFIQICHGVQAIHNSGVTHRDIKPANVLFMTEDTLVVSDLGLAKFDVRDSTILTGAVDFIGTRIYSAPEQLMPDGSRFADERTDIYQLGKTLYEMITGEIPALLDLAKIQKGLRHIITRCTRENPSDRYKTVGKLIDSINLYLLSKDPKSNPRDKFEKALTDAEELLLNNQYSEDNIKFLLDTLKNVDDNADLLVYFDKIPHQLLAMLSHNYHEEFAIMIGDYVEAIKVLVGGYVLSYADTVAAKMNIIFYNTNNSFLKTAALEATLIAAVSLNQFAAMEVFDQMVLSVSNNEDAIPIAEMLEKETIYSKEILSRIPTQNLHPAIRDARIKIINS